MRGPAVERAARRREQALEIPRSGEDARLRRAANAKAAALETLECPLLALADLHGVEAMNIACWRSVDENEQTFGRAIWRLRPIVAILGADVDGRFKGKRATLRDCVELGFIIAGKQHVVPHQRKSLGASADRPGHGGERTGRLRQWRRRRRRALRSKQASGERCNIRVQNNRVRFEPLPTGKHDAARAAVLNEDRADLGVIAEPRAQLAREFAHRDRQLAHSAFDEPYALALDVRDEHQRRGRAKRGRTTVGRVSSEQLAKTRVLKMAREAAPHRTERVDIPEAANSRKTGATDKA